MFPKIKNKKIIILAVLILLTIAVVVIYYLTSQTSQNTEPNIQKPSFSSLEPGVSKEKEVEEKLGEPVESEDFGDLLLKKYKSYNEYRPNEVIYEDNTVKLIVEKIPSDSTLNMYDLINQYGKLNENILYGPLSVGGFYLYSKPEIGLAFIANPNSGTVVEMWYFEPMSFSEFRESYAKDYQDTPIVQD